MHDCVSPWDWEIDCLPLPFVCSAPEVLLVSHLPVFFIVQTCFSNALFKELRFISNN